MNLLPSSDLEGVLAGVGRLGFLPEIPTGSGHLRCDQVSVHGLLSASDGLVQPAGALRALVDAFVFGVIAIHSP